MTFTPFTNRINIQLGNGAYMEAHGSGRINTSAGSFEDVFYVPNLETNLFSIKSVALKNIVVQYCANGVKFIKNNSVVLQV